MADIIEKAPKNKEEISTKVKKLNIIQRLRLRHAIKKLAKNPNYTLDDYLKEPDYIKSDITMRLGIIYDSNIDIEDIRKKVSPELICPLKHDYDFIKKYSTDEINKMIRSNIISPYFYQESDRYELLRRMIEEGFPETLKNSEWGDKTEVEENIYTRISTRGKKRFSSFNINLF